MVEHDWNAWLAGHDLTHAGFLALHGLASGPLPQRELAAAHAAGGAYARKVRHPDEVEEAVAAAMHAVKIEGRAAVLDVWLPHLMDG